MEDTYSFSMMTTLDTLLWSSYPHCLHRLSYHTSTRYSQSSAYRPKSVPTTAHHSMGRSLSPLRKSSGFEHWKKTPKWPQANGEVDRFMCTIKKTIEAAIVYHRPWKYELHNMLRNYRATPHSSTGKPPATALFNRPMRIKVPDVPSPSGHLASIRPHDQLAEAKMKTYADHRVYVKLNNITIGDKVLVSQLWNHYNPKPFVVTNR